jgi:hypothetical protein
MSFPQCVLGVSKKKLTCCIRLRVLLLACYTRRRGCRNIGRTHQNWTTWRRWQMLLPSAIVSAKCRKYCHNSPQDNKKTERLQLSILIFAAVSSKNLGINDMTFILCLKVKCHVNNISPKFFFYFLASLSSAFCEIVYSSKTYRHV